MFYIREETTVEIRSWFEAAQEMSSLVVMEGEKAVK